MFGSTELLVIFLIVLVIFGASSIPKIAKSLGKAKGEFKKGLDESKKENAENIETKKNERHIETETNKN